jgi:hypothetical protein
MTFLKTFLLGLAGFCVLSEPTFAQSDAASRPSAEAQRPAAKMSDVSQPRSRSAPIPVLRAQGRDACDWGPQIRSYLRLALRDLEAKVRAAPPINVDDNVDHIQGYAMVNRPWGRLNVAAVSLHYEGVAVIFKEPLDAVVQDLRARGYRVKKPDNYPGYVVQGGEQLDSPSSDIDSITEGEELKLGQTSWSCGQ